MPKFLITLMLAVVLVSPPSNQCMASHPVSVVQADVHVNKTRTTMKLTCFAEDLELLQGVEALESGIYDGQELLDAVDDHAKYLAKRLEILDVNGEPIPAKITQIIKFDVPDEGIRAGDLMQHVMGFVFEYEHATPPEFLTFRQNMVADGALLPSELQILLKQAGSDTPYTHMMKPGVPQTFRFDWNNPLLASDAAQEDWESWFADQREKTLGIDSYSSTYSFIYINNHEARHEVLIPLATLAALIDFERADDRFLDVSEQSAARKRIEAWFSSGNPVVIDGAQIEPTFDRIDFYGLDLRDFATQTEARKVSMASGRVGVIMSHPATSPPQNVKVTWDMFNHAIRSVDSVIFAYDETSTASFSKFLANNTFSWDAKSKQELPQLTPVAADLDGWTPKMTFNTPWLSAVMAGLAVAVWILMPLLRVTFPRLIIVSAIAIVTAVTCHYSTPSSQYARIPIPFAPASKFTLPDSQAEEVFAKLHANLFQAFDFRDPSDVYDALAQTVDGPLLRKMYLDVQQSLRMREQGGAVARIDDIAILASAPSDPLTTNRSNSAASEALNTSEIVDRPTFGWQCEWNISGTVEHWGHIHQRINQYDAKFNLSACDGAWKITQLQMTDNQGTVKTSLRKLNPER